MILIIRLVDNNQFIRLITVILQLQDHVQLYVQNIITKKFIQMRL